MTYLMATYQVSERRACRAAQFWRSSLRYTSVRDPLTALRQRMRELAETRVRFGYRRLLVLLRREGWEVGKERLYRVYIEEGLALRLSVRGGTRRQSIGSSDARPRIATTFGAWTLSPTS